MSVNTEILLFFIFLLLSAFFSASETAVLAIPKLRLQRLIDNNNTRAKLLKKLMRKPQELISTILIGNNIVNVAAASLATVIVTVMLENSGISNTSYTVIIATVVTTIFLLIFGEITPKSYAIHKPENVALSGIYIMRFLNVILHPLVISFSLLTKIFTKSKQAENINSLTLDDIRALRTVLRENRIFDASHVDMISNIIEFSSRQISEIMIHREDAVFIKKDTTVSEIIEFVKKYKFTRFPVCDGNRDNVVGVFNSINLVNYFDNLTSKIDFEKYISDVIFVSKYSSLLFVLRKMQTNEIPFAIIVDEYGAVDGIATAEDIVEEIVGDIIDENEFKVRKVLKGEIGSNEFKVNGNITFKELEELCGIKIDKDDVDIDTIAGMVWHKIGKKPEIGSIAVVSGYQLKVEQMSRNKIIIVSILKLPEQQTD